MVRKFLGLRILRNSLKGATRIEEEVEIDSPPKLPPYGAEGAITKWEHRSELIPDMLSNVPIRGTLNFLPITSRIGSDG